MKIDSLADWGISHGMYITREDSPYDFYRSIEKHSLKTFYKNINQDVLLLSGAEDHYIPLWQHDYLAEKLSNANVSSRLFTKDDHGEQHCQVGNYKIALDEIIKWLDQNYLLKVKNEKS